MNHPRDAFTRRGFLGTSILFAGGVALSACSTSDPQGKSAGGAKITLNQWYHAYGEKGTQQAAMRYAADYTKANPDVAIKVNWIAGDYESRLNATLLTPGAPDIFEIGDFRYQLAKQGRLAPLDDILGAGSAEFSKADLGPATVDGKSYGIKMIDDIMMLYYRKSVLDKAGVKPPTTFPELLEAAKKLTTGKQKGLYVGTDGVGDAGYLLLWSNGADIIDASNKAVFNSPQAVAALGGLKQLRDAKVLLQGYTTDWVDPAALNQGATAMQWGGLWAMADIKKTLGDDFGVIPWPKFSDSAQPVARLGGWYETVNAKSKNVEEAKKFVQWLWLQQAELQKDWCVKYGFHIPPRKSVAAQTTEFSTGQTKAAVDIAQQYGKAFPNLWNKATTTLFGQAAVKIAQGRGDAASLLNDAAKKSQAEIDKQLA